MLNKFRYSCYIFGAIVLIVGVFLFVPQKIHKEEISKSGIVAQDIAELESEVSSDDQQATLLFVGDIMLSRGIGQIMAKKDDWKYPFLQIADLLKSADITVGNLESPISERGTRMGSIYSFRADPRAIEGLLHAGLGVLSIANNHIWDYGADATNDTISLLEDAGIGVIGGGADYEQAHKAFIKEVKGVKIAFLGYTNLVPVLTTSKTSKPAIASLDVSEIISDISESKKVADLVVVSLHWGNEYETIQSLEQEKIAKALVNAGAKLIIGHHPHVVQPVEEYDGSFIAYSLGNFVFDQNFSPETKKGLVLKVSLVGKEIAQVEQLEVKFSPLFQPYLIPDSQRIIFTK